MKIIFSWPISAIRFFLKKMCLLAYRCHSPQCTWVMIFLQKMVPNQITGMVTAWCKIKHLKMIYRGMSSKTEKKWDSRIEIPNVCMEWATFSMQAHCSTLMTLSSRITKCIMYWRCEVRRCETRNWTCSFILNWQLRFNIFLLLFKVKH